MRSFVEKLHASGQKWVPIHDSGIAAHPGYKVYEDGNKLNVWIKDDTGKPYVGQVRDCDLAALSVCLLSVLVCLARIKIVSHQHRPRGC